MPPKHTKKRPRPVTGLPEGDEGFVRWPQVRQVYPISLTSWWEGIKDGRYPRPVKLGPRTSAWRVRDIRRLLADIDRQPDAP